jgi:diadenosine tetraphosphate (Ap4A) HIT family hydrolase
VFFRRELFDHLIRGENKQVRHEMGQQQRGSVETCRWCRLLWSDEHVVCDAPAYVVMEGLSRRRPGALTLVPKAHVSVVTQLPLQEMASVLAGLSSASDTLRRTSGSSSVSIRAHSRVGGPDRGHLHFQLMTEPPANGRAPEPFAGLVSVGGVPSGDDPGDIRSVDDPSAFASLAEATSH